MHNRRTLTELIIFLSALTVLAVTWMVQVPGAEVRFGPLLIFLYVIPIGIAAYHYGPTAAFWVAVASLGAAGTTFCVPQFIYVAAHDQVDEEGIRLLAERVGAGPGLSLSGKLADYLKGSGSLGGLLDEGFSLSLLRNLWPEEVDFEGAYWSYVARPLVHTGFLWQLVALLAGAPFLGVLAQGGFRQRERLEHARQKMLVLEKALETERAVKSSSALETSEEINRLQSMMITISDMAREISAALQDQTIMKLVLKKTVELLKAREVALFRPDGTGTQLVLVGAVGYDPKKLGTLNIRISEEDGILGWSSKNKLFLAMDEVLADYHKADLAKTNKLDTVYSQPVVRSGELMLVICVGRTDRKLHHKAVARLMSTLANFAAIAIDNARLLEQTRQLAIRDGLTGLYNHRYFQEFLENTLEHCMQHGIPIACILIDLDFFKRLNDSYGHPVGDEVLRRIARVLSEVAPQNGLVARYGGEEFAVVVVGKGLGETRQISERMRRMVEETRIEAPQHTLRVTLSVGGVWHDPARGERVKKELLVQRADEALYQAKENGRNQVYFYGDKTGTQLAQGA